MYQEKLKYWNVKKGETIASIGAQSGILEVSLSLFVDSINWTLEDIDSACLNAAEFKRVYNHFNNISQRKINSNFNLVVGTVSNTNLKSNFYDRVVLINVYHELATKNEILLQIQNALKANGSLIIMEKLAKKRNKKRRDCKHIMPFEPDFLLQLKNANFTLISKQESGKETFFEFRKINLQ